MLPLKRILHPTDFSPCSRGALAYALDLAARFGAELHMLHVTEGEPQPAAAPDLMHPPEADLDIRLREMVGAQLERLDRAAAERLRIEYRLGHNVAPAPAILRYADTHQMDLVVIGTHGRRGLRRMLLGSVTTEVLHESGCDVLTVRVCDEAAFAPPGPRRMLVPLDLSEVSAQVLQEAYALANLLQGRIMLLHVIEPAPFPVYTLGQGGTFDTWVPSLRKAARGRLEGLREEIGLPDGIDVYVDVGPPALIIPKLVEEQGIDLIVMASRSQDGVNRFLLGSVTERVVRRASCPVWVLKSYVTETSGGTAPMATEKLEEDA